MSASHRPGHPTAIDIEQLERINIPALYLDWNVFQYLQALGGSDPLLQVVMAPDVRSALLVPYSNAHLMDATALWSAATLDQRADRLRKVTFVDGLTRSTLWVISGAGDEERHELRPESMWTAADDRGLLTTADELRAAAPNLVADAELGIEDALTAMRAQVEEAVASMDPQARALALATADAAAAALADGLPAVSDGGSLHMKVMRPFFEQVVGMLRAAGCDSDRLARAAPADAVPLLDQFFRAMEPPRSMDEFVSSTSAGGLHPDDLGPQMLGIFGYYPEDKKKIRTSSPGFIPDGTHARYALNSAVFITGDVRLAMRVEAWAHNTGRGLAHGCWPVVGVVAPNDEDSFTRAAEVVAAVADTFPDRLGALTAPG